MDQEVKTPPVTAVPAARHGKLLRGLMSTAKSPSFQGRFGRMFRSLPAASNCAVRLNR